LAHSLVVGEILERGTAANLAVYGYMHDCAEVITGDITAIVKTSSMTDGLEEDAITRGIMKKLCIPLEGWTPETRNLVHEVDLLVTNAEWETVAPDEPRRVVFEPCEPSPMLSLAKDLTNFYASLPSSCWTSGCGPNHNYTGPIALFAARVQVGRRLLDALRQR